MSLTQKWNEHELTVEDIKPWVEKQAGAEKIKLSPQNVETIAFNIWKVYQTVEGLREDYLGHFLTAIRKGDYETAVFRADLLNYRALIIYAKYFYNHSPRSYYDNRKK